MKNQDIKILLSLIISNGSTAYVISKDTKISVPQIMYRLNKLVESKAVTAVVNNDKTLYYVHPALKSEEVINRITVLLKEVADEIDKISYTEPDGLKTIIELIISSIDISDPEEEISDDDILIKNFRANLELYAKEHNLKITDIKGWTEHKLVWMALNDNKCGCAPDKRRCPCKEGLIEIEKKGKCLCSVFERSK